jgi:phosphatidylserine/phosphatidylglycerophosphate/cardiolipin synthase-like enzyme
MSSIRLFLGGAHRAAAADGLAQGLLQSVPLSAEGSYLASHALDFRPLVDRLVACRALGGHVYAMVEGRNLVEDDAAGDHWEPGGDAEPLRRAVCALWRANVPVKVARSSTLLHANMVLSEARRTLFATSANLTATGLGRHADCGIEIADADVVEAVRHEFVRLWRDPWGRGEASGAPIESSDGSITVHVGAHTDVEGAIGRLVAASRTRVRFAVFTFSGHSTVGRDLVRLVERGVDVKGVVDGDQAGLPFDAVPLLRGSGVDVRYVPGVLTGATRRMHHKLLVSDGEVLAVGTHNLSASARSHYEIVVIVRGPEAALACAAADQEIERLLGEGRASMPMLAAPTR